MVRYFGYPLGVIPEVLASFWWRIILFVLACAGGALLATLIRQDDGLSLAVLMYAPLAWLLSPRVLIADVLTLILLVTALLVDSKPAAAVCITGAFLVWFVLGMLLWR